MVYLKTYKFTIGVLILILVGVLMPASDIPSVGIPNMDKVVHAGMFGGLTLCFYGETLRYRKQLPNIGWTWLMIGAFAGTTEVLQHFTPGRSMDFKDVVADLVGMISASLVVVVGVRWRENYLAKKMNQ